MSRILSEDKIYYYKQDLECNLSQRQITKNLQMQSILKCYSKPV